MTEKIIIDFVLVLRGECLEIQEFSVTNGYIKDGEMIVYTKSFNDCLPFLTIDMQLACSSHKRLYKNEYKLLKLYCREIVEPEKTLMMYSRKPVALVLTEPSKPLLSKK